MFPDCGNVSRGRDGAQLRGEFMCVHSSTVQAVVHSAVQSRGEYQQLRIPREIDDSPPIV